MERPKNNAAGVTAAPAPRLTIPPSKTHLGQFGGEKKVQNEQEFRRPHINISTIIQLALIPKLTNPTMEMFSSLDEFWATSEPKSGGAS